MGAVTSNGAGEVVEIGLRSGELDSEQVYLAQPRRVSYRVGEDVDGDRRTPYLQFLQRLQVPDRFQHRRPLVVRELSNESPGKAHVPHGAVDPDRVDEVIQIEVLPDPLQGQFDEARIVLPQFVGASWAVSCVRKRERERRLRV